MAGQEPCVVHGLTGEFVMAADEKGRVEGFAVHDALLQQQVASWAVGRAGDAVEFLVVGGRSDAAPEGEVPVGDGLEAVGDGRFRAEDGRRIGGFVHDAEGEVR